MINQIARDGNTLNGGQPVDEEKEGTYFGLDSSFLVPFWAIVRGFPKLNPAEQVQKYHEIQHRLEYEPENTQEILAQVHVDMNANLHEQRVESIKAAGISYTGPFSELKNRLGGAS